LRRVDERIEIREGALNFEALVWSSGLLVNKFRAFAEWPDMDNHLSNLVQETGIV
jgi:hypothetical protein